MLKIVIFVVCVNVRDDVVVGVGYGGVMRVVEEKRMAAWTSMAITKEIMQVAIKNMTGQN